MSQSEHRACETRRVRLLATETVVTDRGDLVLAGPGEYLASDFGDLVHLEGVGATADSLRVDLSSRQLAGWLNRGEMVYLSW